jgi:hypothetical protein
MTWAPSLARLWLTSVRLSVPEDAEAEDAEDADAEDADAGVEAEGPGLEAELPAASPEPLDEQPAARSTTADTASTLSIWNLRRG